MKFICSVIIDKPKVFVTNLFVKPEFLGEYQEGFVKKNIVKGNYFEVGAISKLYYKMGKGEMELTETVLKNELPDSFAALYVHKHTENTMTSTFISLSDTKTQYNAEINYTSFKGVIVKIMAFLFPIFFKKQVQKWLDNFKVFVEKQS